MLIREMVDGKTRDWRALLRGTSHLFCGVMLMACGHSLEEKSGHAHPGPHEMKHHHAHHRFDDAEKWAARFEDPARDEWQKPEELLSWLALDDAKRIADIGSATGYFPVRLAKRLPQAEIWGIDIEPTMVRYLNERAQKESLPNLHSILGTAVDPMIPEPVDVILLVNTYHHIENRGMYFRQVASRLAKNGRVAIVDFQPGDLPLGPPAHMKISPDQVEAEMTEVGCQLDRQNDSLLPYQFVRVFRCGE